MTIIVSIIESAAFGVTVVSIAINLDLFGSTAFHLLGTAVFQMNPSKKSKNLIIIIIILAVAAVKANHIYCCKRKSIF